MSVLLQQLLTPHNPNNPHFFETIEEPAEYSKRNKVDGFENITVIKSKQQRLNLKKILLNSLKSKLEFLNVLKEDVKLQKPSLRFIHI